MKCRCLCLTSDKTCGEYLLNNHPMKFHRNPIWFKCKHHGLDREYYHITDFDLWCNSDMEDGVKLVVKRVSSESYYSLKERRG
ncbi:MAG: hypothetical protein IJH63_00700 [Methanobrevibacter sp.]|nr:hypothetical protein [Methanosphaera sp.]MBR0369223.1 hypothetical protein [Methanobrevibacter sp.]